MAKRIEKSSPTVASVHRFRDKVGAYIGDNNGTAYLSVAEARRLGEKLLEAAQSIEAESFVDSNVEQLVILADGRF